MGKAAHWHGSVAGEQPLQLVADGPSLVGGHAEANGRRGLDVVAQEGLRGRRLEVALLVLEHEARRPHGLAEDVDMAPG